MYKAVYLTPLYTFLHNIRIVIRIFQREIGRKIRIVEPGSENIKIRLSIDDDYVLEIESYENYSPG